MNRSSAEVEGEVEATRSRLDENVEALKQKMTPGQMFDEAARMMGGTGQQVASKFAEQAKANPMPLAVMGLGLAWLMASNNKSQDQGERRSFAPGDEYGYALQGQGSGGRGGSGAGLTERLHDMGEQAAGAISGARHKLADGVSGMGSSMGERAQGAAQQIGDAAGAARERVSQVAGHAQDTFLQTLEREPLLIAGLGLLVGAAIGAAIPSTPAEDRLMGETRDKLMTKGKDLADSGMQKATSVAQSAYGAVKSELQDGQGGDLGERIEGAVRSGVEAVRNEVQPGSAH